MFGCVVIVGFVMFCTKCGSESVFRSGFVKGEQRYRCRECGRQFVPTRHHGKGEPQKLIAILLYINGLSLRTIARLIHVTATAVLKWVRQYAIENYEKLKPQQNTSIVIELDEVWHYLKSKKTSFGFGKHIVALPISSLTGNVGIEMAKHFKGCWIGYENGM
jgi:transposase